MTVRFSPCSLCESFSPFMIQGLCILGIHRQVEV